MAPPPTPARLRGALLRWFGVHQRDLPWRHTRDPYAIWVSEVMLQQTQVATVIPYWHRFLGRFPTVEALAGAALPEVLAGWRGLGYYSRARNLKAAAEAVVALHGGALPRTAAELRALPGFGRYTAGAVASIAFGEQAPLVDGNVARVLSRLFLVEGAPGASGREARLWELAGALVRGPRPGELNQALMELGALVCRVEAPGCSTCPLRRGCGALARGRVAELPQKKVRPIRKRLALAVAVWRRGGAFLLGRRGEAGLFGGLWELPCAQVEPGADPAATLCLALGGAKVGEALGTVRRTLTHRDLELRLYRVRAARAPRALQGYQQLGWVTPARAGTLGMSKAMEVALAAAITKTPPSSSGRAKPGSVA